MRGMMPDRDDVPYPRRKITRVPGCTAGRASSSHPEVAVTETLANAVAAADGRALPQPYVYRHNPLVEPEDLLTAKIVACTPRAKQFGIEIGMTGQEAVERMLAASSK